MYTSRKPEVIGNILEELNALDEIAFREIDVYQYSVVGNKNEKLSRGDKNIVSQVHKSVEAKILSVKIGKLVSTRYEKATALPGELCREFTGNWHNDVLDRKHIRDRKIILATSNFALGTQFVYGTFENPISDYYNFDNIVKEGLENGQFSYWKEYGAGDLVYAPATTLHRSPVNATQEVQSRIFQRTWLDV